MKNKKISIIIPCYNCEEWLERTFDSLKKQTCNDFEVVFVNDGSKDNSLNVAKNILENSNIQHTIIDKKNEGVSIARNIGIENASGDYIYFLDSDDYVEKNLCETIIEIFSQNMVDSVFFQYNSQKEYNYNKYNTPLDSKEVLIDFFHYRFMQHICAFAIKRNILMEKEIRFTEGVRYGEDNEYLVKALCNCKKTIIIQEKLFNYCDREGSAVQKFDSGRMDSLYTILRVNKYVENCFKDNNINKESHQYVASKIIYNIGELVKFKKNKRVEPEVEKNILEFAKKHKKYIREYIIFNRKEKIEKSYILLYISPGLFCKYYAKK